MNGGMIRGSDVRVEVATRENGYVELTAEAAKNPWAVIGKFSYSKALKSLFRHHAWSQLEDLLK